VTAATADPLGTRGRSSRERLELLLARIAEVEPVVRAFAWLDGDRARRLAAAADSVSGGGALHGVALGVKDIIDTAGIPTECGTPLLAGRVPARSAPVVEALERAGAYVLGKTVTAELAFAAPGPTRNPWDAGRTPGGSSMGSAAGVAAGMFPAAIGTQTNSSIVMPAALCGVVGYKPTAGRLPTDGVLRFSATLDQVGSLAGSVAGAAVVAAAMAGDREPQAPSLERRPPVLAVAEMPETAEAAPAVRRRLAHALAVVRAAGARVESAALHGPLGEGRAVHRTIMAYEAAATIGPLVQREPEAASGVLRRFLAEGAAVTEVGHREALERRAGLAELVDELARPFDALVCPAAPDEAPSRETTGDPRFCTLWTLAGAPTLTLPNGRGPAGLPIGLQLVAARGEDDVLLRTAAWVEAALAGTADDR
jgi:Asp-tRNA(Asn)/Glu-tRNA(Gln) amidotransferase A subunit family amidase